MGRQSFPALQAFFAGALPANKYAGMQDTMRTDLGWNKRTAVRVFAPFPWRALAGWYYTADSGKIAARPVLKRTPGLPVALGHGDNRCR